VFVDAVSKDVDFEELARCTDDFNGAQCKAVCVEAVSYSRLLFLCKILSVIIEDKTIAFLKFGSRHVD